MRFRRSKGIPIPIKQKRAIGRPKGWRKHNRVLTSIRVSDNLKDTLESECRPNERFNDTIERLLRERTQAIEALRKEIDTLRNNHLYIDK
jgi:hypothetical protein